MEDKIISFKNYFYLSCKRFFENGLQSRIGFGTTTILPASKGLMVNLIILYLLQVEQVS